MQFLFEVRSIDNGRPVYYQVYETGEDSYFAESMLSKDGFYLEKVNRMWMTEQANEQRHAEQIGKRIDEFEAIQMIGID